MALVPKFSIDSAAATASVELYVDAQLVTSYQFAAGAFALPERLTQLVLTLEQLVENVDTLNRWYNMILRYIVPVSGSLADFTFDLNGDTIKYRVKTKINSILYTNAKCVVATNIVTFEPRPSASFTVREFAKFLWALQHFIVLCKGY